MIHFNPEQRPTDLNLESSRITSETEDILNSFSPLQINDVIMRTFTTS